MEEKKAEAKAEAKKLESKSGPGNRKNVFVYYPDDEFRDFISVEFTEDGSQVALRWCSPLLGYDSNMWRDRFDDVKGYYHWSYQKFNPQKLEKEIIARFNDGLAYDQGEGDQ